MVWAGQYGIRSREFTFLPHPYGGPEATPVFAGMMVWVGQ